MLFLREPGLLARFREGERAALERVYWAYVDAVTRVVQAVVSHHAPLPSARIEGAAAELGDLVQEVFVRAFAPQTRASFDGCRPYGHYLAQIARNVVVDHWRATRRQVPLDLDPLLDAMSLEADDAGKHTERWADGETVAAVERYLAALSPELQQVHDALYVRGLSQREAAAALGLGRQAVRGLESRLRAGLRRHLQDSGQLEPDGLALGSLSSAPARGHGR
jgi:RNA polymerase sigma-70 factor (ECF subfamily)